MKKSPFALLLLILLPIAASADVLGGRIQANAWLQEYSGDTRHGSDSIDVESDLGFDDDTNYQGIIALEHPVPLIPNLMLQQTAIDVDASGALSGVEFDGRLYDGDVVSELDLTHTDITLYYELLDNWVNLDVGVTGRVFDGGIKIANRLVGVGEVEMDSVVPMVYAQARFDLPFTGWYVGAGGNLGSWGDDKVTDLQVMLGWNFFMGIGAELGYRQMDVDSKDGNERLDVTVDGVYGGLFWDF